MEKKAIELREERAKIVAEAHAGLVDEELTTEARVAKCDELMARADELMAEIEAIERVILAERNLESRIELKATKAGVSTDEQTAQEETEKRIWNKYLHQGIQGMDGDEIAYMQRLQNPDPGVQAALTTGTGSSGGFTIPEGFRMTLEEALLAYGGGMTDPAVVDVLRTSTGNPYMMPTDNDTAQKGERIAENTQINEQDVVFGQLQIDAWLYSSKLVRVPLTLMQDSAFDLNAYLGRKLGERIGRILADELTVGAGTAGIPNGIVTASTLGKTAAAVAAVTYPELVDLEHSVDPSYRAQDAKWMFHDLTLAALKKLLDDQSRPLWTPGMAFNAPDRILSYPYVINQSMPQLATGEKTILFGNFKKYMTRITRDVTLLRLTERYADYLQVGFTAFARADGELLDAGTNPVKHLIQA